MHWFGAKLFVYLLPVGQPTAAWWVLTAKRMMCGKTAAWQNTSHNNASGTAHCSLLEIYIIKHKTRVSKAFFCKKQDWNELVDPVRSSRSMELKLSSRCCRSWCVHRHWCEEFSESAGVWICAHCPDSSIALWGDHHPPVSSCHGKGWFFRVECNGHGSPNRPNRVPAWVVRIGHEGLYALWKRARPRLRCLDRLF